MSPGPSRGADRKLLIVEKEGREEGSSPGRKQRVPSALAVCRLAPAGTEGGVAWKKCITMATVTNPLRCLSQALCSVHRFWQESARSESGLQKQRGSAKPTAAGTRAASPNRPARQETSQHSIFCPVPPTTPQPSRPPGTSRATTSCKLQGFYRARRSWGLELPGTRFGSGCCSKPAALVALGFFALPFQPPWRFTVTFLKMR